MEKTKILYISQEITPYLPESEMSMIGRHLPQGIQEMGKEIRTFMPRFGCVNERRNQLHEVIRLSGMNLIINDTDHPLIIKVASIQAARMQVYFIDNEDYFYRKHVFGDDDGNEFADNDERTIFFTRGVLETVKKLRWSPDIVHCHGWFTALVPLYLKKAFKEDPLFHESKIVYSVYDDEFHRPMNDSFVEKLIIEGVEEEDIAGLKTPNYQNLSELAINFADAVIYGSDNISPNLKKFIESTNKPVLPNMELDKIVDEYSKFYDKLLEGVYEHV
ncbi:MAG: glycogen/starch synthase [Bacteroidales bacterium]|nr:glycogen/starch synthase [Bacteroidales bacterium]MCF8455374.1 glycogen/starch synthase [Bacteroidales bacterium]